MLATTAAIPMMNVHSSIMHNDSDSQLRSISVHICGAPNSGKKALRSLLQDAASYERSVDGQSFTYHPPSDDRQHTADIALVTCDVRVPFPSLGALIKIAHGHSARVCVVFTKLDLVSRDLNPIQGDHIGHLRHIAYRYDVDCIAVSLVSREGVDDLLAHIANKTYPVLVQRSHDLKSFVTACYEIFKDFTASIFALPPPKPIANPDAELEALANASDPSSLRYDPEWEDTLKQRLGVISNFPVPFHRLTRTLLAKADLSSSEIAAMQFARCNTSIPLPRIHRPRDDLAVMDFIEGRMLCECWETLSRFMRFRIVCTLRLYVKQMHALQGTRYGAVDNGHLQGVLFEENVFAPFSSPTRFRRFCEHVAYVGWRTRALHERSSRGTAPALPCPDLDWTPVFIHGDLNASNILLDHRCALWLVDWGMSGFYPASMESSTMRLVDGALRPNTIRSWSEYRSFIAGHTSKEEEEFWQDFNSAIHRFPSTHAR